jgi:hypothetical protein
VASTEIFGIGNPIVDVIARADDGVSRCQPRRRLLLRLVFRAR